jgi:hypothetical protein
MFTFIPLSCHLPAFTSGKTPSPTLQNLFHSPFLRFCERKNIKDSKRNIVFLLVLIKIAIQGCVVSMHICIKTPVSSSLPVLFTTP